MTLFATTMLYNIPCVRAVRYNVGQVCEILPIHYMHAYVAYHIAEKNSFGCCHLVLKTRTNSRSKACL